MGVRSRCIVPLVILAIGSGGGCGQSDPEVARATAAQAQLVAAIRSVLTAEKDLAFNRGDLPANASRSRIADQFIEYADAAAKLDTEACPLAFKGAFESHHKSWRGLGVAVRGLPEDFFADGWLGFEKSLGGEIGSGQTRPEKAVKQWVTYVRDTRTQIDAIARGHGVRP